MQRYANRDKDAEMSSILLYFVCTTQLDFSNATTLWTCLIYRPGEKHHFIREDLKYPYNSSLERRKTDTRISFNDDLCIVNGDEIVFEPEVN